MAPILEQVSHMST